MSDDLQTRTARDGSGERRVVGADGGPVSSSGRRRPFDRRPLIRASSGTTQWAAAALWVASALCWIPNPAVGIVLLFAGMVVLWRRKIPTHVAVLAVPTAFVVFWCALGQLLALADVTFLTSRLGWTLGWIVVTLAVLAAGGRPLRWLAETRLGSDRTQSPVTRVSGSLRWTFLPAVLFSGVAAVQSSSFDLVSRWFTNGTDPMQLVLLIQQMAREGALITTRNLGGDGNLAGQAYPKGLHWVITAALGPSVDPSALSSAQTLELYIRTFAGFVWLTIGVMLCVAAGLFLSATRRWQLSPSVPAVASGLLLVAVLGVQQFGAVVVIQGALASGAAVACVWALLWVSLTDVRLRVQIAVLGCGLFVTANTWQPITVVVATIGAFLLWPRRRAILTWLGSRRLHGFWRIATVVAVGWLAVVLTLVPVTGLLLAGGAQHASATGGISGPSLPILTLEIALFLVVAIRFRLFRRLSRSGLARTVVGAILGSELVWLAMAAATRGDIDAYYPRKVVWFATTFGWPLLALAVAFVLVRLGRRIGAMLGCSQDGWRSRLVPTLALVALLGLLAGATFLGRGSPPSMAAAGAGVLDRPAYLSVVALPDPPAGEHYVPYLLDGPWKYPWQRSYIAAKFLAFRFDAPYLEWATDEPACAIIRRQLPAILVTTRSHEEVADALRREHCSVTSWRTLQLH